MTAASRLAAIEGPVTRGDLPAHRRADIEMAKAKLCAAAELFFVEADCAAAQCDEFRELLGDMIEDATGPQLRDIEYEEEGVW